MLTQQQFHISEFRAMATAFIQLEVKKKRLKVAQSWVDMWKSIEPDHEGVKLFQQQIDANTISKGLLKLLASWRR